MARQIERTYVEVTGYGYRVSQAMEDDRGNPSTDIQVTLARRNEFGDKETEDMAVIMSVLVVLVRQIVTEADAPSMVNITSEKALQKMQAEVVNPLADRAQELNSGYQAVNSNEITVRDRGFTFVGQMFGITGFATWLETAQELDRSTAIISLTEFANAMASLPPGGVHKGLDLTSKKLRAHGSSLDNKVKEGKERLQ